MNGDVQAWRLPCPGHRDAQRHTHFTHAHFQLIGGRLNRVMHVFGSPVGQGGEFIAHHFQRLARHRAQMFFRRVGVKLAEIFVEIAAGLRHLFKGFAALAQQFHQLRQLRAVAGIDIFLLDMPLQVRRHILRCQRINVVVVQPQQFIGVERARRFADRIKREEFDHLFTREDLLIAVRPAQTHQVVQQRFRQIAVVAILHDAHRAVTFGEFFTVIAVDHRDVRVKRYRRAQRFQDVDLTRRVVDMVFTTDHVRDFHIPVVHDYTEVVRRGTVSTTDDQIVKLQVAEFNRAADLIVKHDRTILRVRKTHDARLIVSMMLMAVAATAVITRLFALRHLLFAQRFQTLFRAIAFICRTRRQHFINHRVVAIEAFGLEIRAFIPLQAQPVHPIHNGFDGFRRGALKIGVFNTQHKFATLIAGEKPGIKSGTGATDVQIAGRAWREAGFDFH
ncbi:conserved hypothetical protein [Cronobacter malonaticus 507]|nr:conserved hypothetical protein [Cronobacter malonaticus 507]